MMKLSIEIDEKVLKTLVHKYLEEMGISVPRETIHIEVKSKQNYKSLWEAADFRARVEHSEA